MVECQTRVFQPGKHRLHPFGTLGMARARVVEQSRGVAGNYYIHLLTLPQVASLLRLEGSWPGPLSLRAGWFRARARPWNEVVSAPMVRLERGGAEFLIAVRNELADLTGEAVYSPALFPGSTRVWRRSGFGDYSELTVMERSLTHISSTGTGHAVQTSVEPDWDPILEVDRAAFAGFWGMSRLGLEEAYVTNRETTLLTVSTVGEPEGFAIVGSQWGIAYLHRIAVLPERSGQGFGRSLLSAAMKWGAASGARSMVLNVRADNLRAQALYRRSGFTSTGTNLQILRYAVG